MKNPDFDQIKRTTDLVRVVESYGVALKRQGKEFVGLCPFHEDHSPSLHVNTEKSLFRCMSCGAAGNAIQFVARKEGIAEREAALKLLSQIPGVRCAEDATARSITATAGQAIEGRRSTVSEAERAKLLQRVVGFYAKTLFKDRTGLDYLKTRKLDDPTMLEVFQVGYCNGTLHQALPQNKGRLAPSHGVIEQLKAIGILWKNGQEVFAGRVTVPIFDLQGNVCGLYARNVQPCEASERHRYLVGGHRGVFNGACAKTTQTLLITEAIFDTMAFWQAGFRNAVSLYGNQGWTAEHEKLFQENPITEVYLCLDNDPPVGDRRAPSREATERLREKLSGMVKAVHVIPWPEGVKDATEFFMSRSAADFEALLKVANPTTEQKSETTERLGEEKIEMTPGGFVATYGSRRYELMAIEKSSAARLKATVKALGAEAGRFHIDTVDFYLSRSRRNFLVEVARLFRETPEVIEMDLNRLTVQLESYVEKRMSENTPRVALVSEGDKMEALRLGRNPDLVAEILRDMEKLGAVGESVNKLIGYLAMTSRKMDDPLALLILSGSGAGKSHLQDTILSLCPDEDLIKLTSLSDRALFYKGEDSLRHKVLAVEEEAGASGAHYAIRNLISSKKLVIETTIKNPLTGKMETQVNVVHGRTSVFLTTTNPEIHAETKSRFIITSVDESAEQTRAILTAQRQSHTLEGMRREHRRGAILSRHHAFQRMLKPLAVLNPFEPLLTYGDDRLLDRRDNPKYLRLIVAVTFLFQMQRAVKRDAETGREYIEATLDDVAIANELAVAFFGHSLDDLSSPSRRLLGEICDYIRQRGSKARFCRRDLREAFKWSDTRLRVHLAELVRLEYVLPVGGAMGRAFEYQLACDPDQLEGGKLFVPGLKSVEQLRKEADLAAFSVGVAAQNRGVAATPPLKNGGVKKAGFHSQNGNGESHPAAFSGEHIPVFGENGEKGSVVIGAAESAR